MTFAGAKRVKEDTDVADGVDIKWAAYLVVSPANKLASILLFDVHVIVDVVHDCLVVLRHHGYNINLSKIEEMECYV